jgi:chromosome segregation ATPase
MNKNALLAGMFLLILAAGCGPVSDDPRQGGLMGYWHGTSSGKYEERQQQKRQQLRDEQAANQQLSEQSAALESERAMQDRKLAQEQKQIAALKNKLTTLKANVSKLRLQSDQQKEQASSLLDQIQVTNQRLEKQKAAIAELDRKGGSASDPDQARILELERDRLADEYRKLNKYYQALSNAIH